MTEYEIIRKTVKRLTIRIREDGAVQVIAPARMNDKTIQCFIHEKEEWIIRHRQQMLQLQQERVTIGLHNSYTPDGRIVYLGNYYPLRIQSEGKQSWSWNGSRLNVSGCRTEQAVKKQVEAFYRTQMLEEILPAINKEVRGRLSDLSLPDPVIEVQKMRARWGTCYPTEQRIRMNLWLAMAPRECIRQVLIHEYLHFCQNNHAAAFYRLMDRYEPQHRKLKEQLHILIDLRENIAN